MGRCSWFVVHGILFSVYVVFSSLLDKKPQPLKHYFEQGGTVIGTARSTSFRTSEGRLKAAKNMIISGLDSLIVIGGDGSLTGADMLRSEWPSLVQKLIESGDIKEADISESQKHLTIVGLVGSIDNDMSSTGLFCFFIL